MEHIRIDTFVKLRNWLEENMVKPIETPYGNYWILLSSEEYIKECLDEFNDTVCSTSTPYFTWSDDNFIKLKEYAINVFKSTYDFDKHEMNIENYLSVLPFKNMKFICSNIAVCTKDKQEGND